MISNSLTEKLKFINEHKLPSNSGTAKTIEDFWNKFIVPTLPDKNIVLQWHKVLMDYIKQPNAMYALRGFNSAKIYNDLRRGWLTRIKNTDISFFYTDNFHAFYYFKMAKDGYIPTCKDLIETYNSRLFPARFGPNTSEEREKAAVPNGKDPGISAAGYKLSHIFDAGKNYWLDNNSMNNKKILDTYFPKGERSDWSQETDENGSFYVRNIVWEPAIAEKHKKILIAMFLRFVHPFNYFLTPKKDMQVNDVCPDIGEYPPLLEFIKSKFLDIYGDAYKEFMALIMLPENTTIIGVKNEIINLTYGEDKTLTSKSEKTSINSVSIKSLPDTLHKNIKNHSSLNNLKIGEFVRFYIIPLLQSGKIPENEIKNLQNIEYCCKTFNIQAKTFPVLSKSPMIDSKGYNRSYAKPIVVNGQNFYVFSQWYDKNYSETRQWYNKFNK